MPLSPVNGEWVVHDQPDGWKDTDPVIHGYFNKNITVTMNIPQDTRMSILMKAGNDVISHYGEAADSVFESYPEFWSDDSGLKPSGIDSQLIGLQFLETRIIVREKEYYDKKPPITIEVTFEHGSQVFKRQYKLELTWDHYYSGKGNPFVCDLQQLGIPFVAKHKEWTGWQPVTGEYLYSSSIPMPARVEFNGYWVGCFADGVEAKLNFSAFQPFQKADGPHIVTGSSIGASLDLCTAGLEGVATKARLPSLIKFNWGRHEYSLLETPKGSYVFEGFGHPWNVFFTESKLDLNNLPVMKNTFGLWSQHDFEKDPLGHHRAKVGNISFWEVLDVDHPAPAFGGTHGGSLPIEFIHGIVGYIVKHPNWWMRIGKFPIAI
jgi:hypothetical protein